MLDFKSQREVKEYIENMDRDMLYEIHPWKFDSSRFVGLDAIHDEHEKEPF